MEFLIIVETANGDKTIKTIILMQNQNQHNILSKNEILL